MAKSVEDVFRASYMPEMPPVSGGMYLIDYLMEIGPVMSSGMGPVEITSANLISWREETGIELQPWESKFIRHLSREYLAQSQKAADRKCPPPWKEN